MKSKRPKSNDPQRPPAEEHQRPRYTNAEVTQIQPPTTHAERQSIQKRDAHIDQRTTNSPKESHPRCPMNATMDRGLTWSAVETADLTTAWVSAIENPLTGIKQTSDAFSKQKVNILGEYQQTMADEKTYS